MSMACLFAMVLHQLMCCSLASFGVSLYKDKNCQSTYVSNYENWDVSESGCCTVTDTNATRYLQYLCVDGGLVEIVYAKAGCSGHVISRNAKTRNWWTQAVKGGCTFDDRESSYIKFSVPPPVSIQSRAGKCNAPPALQLFKYKDHQCTIPNGEEELKRQPITSTGCFDVTISGSDGSRVSSRAGAIFQCSDDLVSHDLFRDYMYCSGDSLRNQVHTWAWFHAYSSGECVQDLSSNSYLKLMSAVPHSWLEHMQPCSDKVAARVESFTESSCSGSANANSVVEWKSISANGCISVVQTSRAMPRYSHRFRCEGKGNASKIVLDAFSGTSCQNILQQPGPLRQEWNVTTGLNFLSGSCLPEAPGQFRKLSMVSPDIKSKLLSILGTCGEEDVAEVDPIAAVETKFDELWNQSLRGGKAKAESGGVRQFAVQAASVFTAWAIMSSF